MRLGDTSKQCLWLGTHRYRRGCRNAAANPNRVADTCVQRYSVRSDNAIAHSYTDGDSYSATGDANANTYGNRDATAYGDANTYREFAPAVAHAATAGNTKASSNTASSSDAVSIG